jgi:hypothetical protein
VMTSTRSSSASLNRVRAWSTKYPTSTNRLPTVPSRAGMDSVLTGRAATNDGMSTAASGVAVAEGVSLMCLSDAPRRCKSPDNRPSAANSSCNGSNTAPLNFTSSVIVVDNRHRRLAYALAVRVTWR